MNAAAAAELVTTSSRIVNDWNIAHGFGQDRKNFYRIEPFPDIKFQSHLRSAVVECVWSVKPDALLPSVVARSDAIRLAMPERSVRGCRC